MFHFYFLTFWQPYFSGKSLRLKMLIVAAVGYSLFVNYMYERSSKNSHCFFQVEWSYEEAVF
jgi:hypothetical protein